MGFLNGTMDRVTLHILAPEDRPYKPRRVNGDAGLQTDRGGSQPRPNCVQASGPPVARSTRRCHLAVVVRSRLYGTVGPATSRH